MLAGHDSHAAWPRADLNELAGQSSQAAVVVIAGLLRTRIHTWSACTASVSLSRPLVSPALTASVHVWLASQAARSL